MLRKLEHSFRSIDSSKPPYFGTLFCTYSVKWGNYITLLCASLPLFPKCLLVQVEAFLWWWLCGAVIPSASSTLATQCKEIISFLQLLFLHPSVNNSSSLAFLKACVCVSITQIFSSLTRILPGWVCVLKFQMRRGSSGALFCSPPSQGCCWQTLIFIV